MQTALDGAFEVMTNFFKIQVSGALKFNIRPASSQNGPQIEPSTPTPALRQPASIQCTVCLDNFQRPIKSLECGHSFCLQCLIGWRNRTATSFGIRCPLCRRLSSLPQGRLRQLPTNVMLEQILENQRMLRGGGEPSNTRARVGTSHSGSIIGWNRRNRAYIESRSQWGRYIYMDAPTISGSDRAPSESSLVIMMTAPSFTYRSGTSTVESRTASVSTS